MSNRAKVISFASRKGGVGKTVCTGLMARYFTEVEGKNVVVIDLGGRGGVTSLLANVSAGKEGLSISEVIQTAGNQRNFQDVFRQSIFDTGLSKNKYWSDNGGKLFLLPSKPNLETVLANNHSSLLEVIIRNTPLPNDMLILIDTGSSQNSVLAGIRAADIVFVPLIVSRQDSLPLFYTLRIINVLQKQRGDSSPVMGGMIINQPGDTPREKEYVNAYRLTLDEYRKESNLRCVSEDQFFFLKTSGAIRNCAFLERALQKDFYTLGKKLAKIVHQV